ncbi:uncharacterized protein BDV14DRAFT_172426 [Aspergillus stella-maris]|uniref:uncharacterized protein n=1 Tax=Aspergillus stella-maris TaxID=1810926 RepID=UPI003CCCB28B
MKAPFPLSELSHSPSNSISLVPCSEITTITMSPEFIEAPLTQPKTRRRAATDKPRSSRASSLSSRPSLAMNPPAISVYRSEDAKNQAAGGYARARATSGPLRQPKPLSPSDIHSILEQEQEAMVNRLSRELSLLRHQSSSVASTASSTSTTLNEPLDAFHSSPYIPGPIYPTASRQHRSSSSLSGSYFPVIQESRKNGRGRPPSIVSPSQSLISITSQPQERRRDASAHLTHSSRVPRRSSLSQQRVPSGAGLGLGSSRLDDMTPRGDVESLLNENEELRRRIQALELELSVKKTQERPGKE